MYFSWINDTVHQTQSIAAKVNLVWLHFTAEIVEGFSLIWKAVQWTVIVFVLLHLVLVITCCLNPMLNWEEKAFLAVGIPAVGAIHGVMVGLVIGGILLGWRLFGWANLVLIVSLFVCTSFAYWSGSHFISSFFDELILTLATGFTQVTTMQAAHISQPIVMILLLPLLLIKFLTLVDAWMALFQLVMAIFAVGLAGVASGLTLSFVPLAWTMLNRLQARGQAQSLVLQSVPGNNPFPL
ncbi:MAG: hypothetical protein HY774_28125 [Acidobacteria bacterium]|nr:hypothetical protein [Acidobacteriota bacterium]